MALTTAQRRRQRENQRYWEKREREALQHQELTRRADTYGRHISGVYARMIDNVQRDIDAFYSRYASAEGISLAEAKKRANKLDIEAYARKAKHYVETKDFSKKANEELRLYNMTMKVNRLELLKANIGLELVDGFDELQKYYDETLTEETLAEFRRQAGILGKTVLDLSGSADAIVNGSWHNGTFSSRIWQYQDELRMLLGKQLQTGLISGKNPRVLAADIRKTFGASRYNAERLMRTELARVHVEAQKQSFEENEVQEFEFIANGRTACPICRDLDGQHFSVKDMVIGKNAPPMHPNCMCSTAPWMDEAEYQEWLESFGNGAAENFIEAKNQEEAVDYLKGNLGFVGATLKGMSLKSINDVNKALTFLYAKHPQMKGFIQKVKADKNCSGVAAFVVRYKNGVISTELQLNPIDLANTDAINALVDTTVQSGFWTSKQGVQGILEHEFGHALEAQRTFEEYGVDPLSKDINAKIDRYMAFQKYKRHEIAERELTNAFANSKMALTEDDLGKYISEYAKKDYQKTRNYAEAFAEAMSDNKPNIITGYIQKNVEGW